MQLLGQGRPRPRSLPATGNNFAKPWFFINLNRSRISSFYFALKFVD